jgi:hypothetical protein
MAGNIFRRRCRHPKWSKIRDGYQYCTVCNRAAEPRRPEQQKCLHVLEDAGSTTRMTLHGDGEQGQRQQQCRKCGKRFTYNTTIGRYEHEAPVCAEGSE